MEESEDSSVPEPNRSAIERDSSHRRGLQQPEEQIMAQGNPRQLPHARAARRRKWMERAHGSCCELNRGAKRGPGGSAKANNRRTFRASSSFIMASPMSSLTI